MSFSAITRLYQAPTTEAEFVRMLLEQFMLGMTTRVTNNYDYRLFSFDGNDRSHYQYIDQRADYLDYFMRNAAGFYSSWRNLADNASKQLFVQLMLYRLCGHQHIAIKEDQNWITESQLINKIQLLPSTPSTLEAKGIFGNLQHFEQVQFNGRPIKFDGWVGNILFSFLKKQYFLSRGNVTIQPEDGDFAIDAGACMGDSALTFASAVGPSGHVFSFDPLAQHIEYTAFNAQQNNFHNISAVQYGLADFEYSPNTSHTCTAEKNYRPDFSLCHPGHNLPITTIDSFMDQNKVHKMDFIKMDIEGFELAALKGGLKTISRHKPKLAISLYHKNEDFVDIPAFISQHFPFYGMYLDHYSLHKGETILYCTVQHDASTTGKPTAA